MKSIRKPHVFCKWLAVPVVLLAFTLAPQGMFTQNALAGVNLKISKELQELQEGTAKLHLPSQRYRFAVFTFEDPDGTGLGNTIASILSHELLMNSKVMSIGVLRYEGDLSKADGERQLRYFDKVEPLIESQGVQVAIWGTIRRSGDRMQIDSFIQISPSVMDNTFSFAFKFPPNMGEGQLVHRIGPDRILAQREELTVEQTLTLDEIARDIDRLRTVPQDSAPISAQLQQDEVYYLQQRKGQWVKVSTRSGKSGWLRASGYCQGPCRRLLAVARFAGELMDYDSAGTIPWRSEDLADDAKVFIDQLRAIGKLNNYATVSTVTQALKDIEPWCNTRGIDGQIMPSPGGAATCNLRGVIHFLDSVGMAYPHQPNKNQMLSVVQELSSASMLDPLYVPTLKNLSTLYGMLGDTERSELADILAKRALKDQATK